jgi:amino acid transporter
MTTSTSANEAGEAGAKGLKTGAIGFVSGVVIGVASTAPGYSLAAVLGFVVAVVGFQAPAVLLLAFVPMLLIAASYYYLNRADPDCGTTFAWVTRAMGPYWGWMGGWGIIVADIIVMANLAEVASIYSFELFGITTDNKWVVVGLGVVWIAVMTWVTWRGIELSARTQLVLLGAEISALVLFSVVALARVAFGNVPGSVTPSLSWLNPFAIQGAGGSGALQAMTAGLLLSLFIYWGWDSTVTVNEETEDSTEAPGRAAVWSTVILLAIYVVVSVAAIAFQGTDYLSLEEHQDDALGALAHEVLGPLAFVLIIAVLTSAAASTQTTILPTARTMLSMGAKGAVPRYWARIHPRYLTPGPATIWMGVLSVVWYVGLKLVSENILYDAIAALGLMIAFYYGLTGYAAVIYYRRHLFDSLKAFVMVGVAPLLGALILTWALVRSAIDLSDPANSESGDSWFGWGPPLVIGVGFLVIGLVLMVVCRMTMPEFFRRRPEVVPDHIGRSVTHGRATSDDQEAGS